MDKKQTGFGTRGGGRRVTKSTTEYDWGSLERRAERERAANKSEAQPSKLEQKIRYQKKQKRQRLRIQRRRAVIGVITAAITVSVLLFLTPIFNIRNVSVEGNNLVSAEQFEEALRPLIGENLFRTSAGKIRKTLKTIPYIDDAHIQKRIFPPSVNVTVTEYVPAAILRIEGKNLLVNSELRVLTDDGEIPVSVPTVTGLSVEGYKIGEIIKCEDTEKTDLLFNALATMEDTGLTENMIEIDVNDIADITMNYDNRFELLCGSPLDIDRKLRLFRETLSSSSLAENARGTMDLSETGKAVYTPQ